MSGVLQRWGAGPSVRAILAVLGMVYAALRFGPAAGLATLLAGGLVIGLDALVRIGPSRGSAGVLTRALAGVAQMLALGVLFFGPAPMGLGSTPAPVFLLSPLLLLMFCLVASYMEPQRPLLTPIMGVACAGLWWWAKSFALAQPGVIVRARFGAAVVKSPVQLMTNVSAPHYFNEGLWRNDLVIVLLISFLFTITVWRAHRLAVVSSRREAARNVMASYFSPQVVETIVGGGAEGFRPRRLQVAVMESDLVGFTRLAESLTPEAAAETLSRYRRAVENAVFAEDGAILNWTGDGATAVFGLLDSGGAAAARALRCARRLQEDWPVEAATLAAKVEAFSS